MYLSLASNVLHFSSAVVDILDLSLCNSAAASIILRLVAAVVTITGDSMPLVGCFLKKNI